MEKVYLTQQSYPENILQLQIVKVISLYPLKIQFPFKLEISYIGYETCHVMIEASKQDSTIVIELQPDIINLPEVIIRQKNSYSSRKVLVMSIGYGKTKSKSLISRN